jgi:integrase
MRLIDCAANPLHRAMLMTLYSTGVRRSELVKLKVSDVDSQRMVIHVYQGKGNRVNIPSARTQDRAQSPVRMLIIRQGGKEKNWARSAKILGQ